MCPVRSEEISPFHSGWDGVETSQGDGLLGDSTFSLAPNASSTYTLYYSPLKVQSHFGSITFAADAVGEFWYRLELRADPCPPVR